MKVLTIACAMGVLVGVTAPTPAQAGPLTFHDLGTVERWWMGDGSEPVSVVIHVNQLNTMLLTDFDPTFPPEPAFDPFPPIAGFTELLGDTLPPQGSILLPLTEPVCAFDCGDEVSAYSVPEPGVALLLGGALLTLVVRRRGGVQLTRT